MPECNPRMDMPHFYLVRYPEPPVLVPEKTKVTIGRAHSNTIVLHESRVSRLHAQIEWQYSLKAWAITDLGSANGTYVNGGRIAVLAQRQLADRDKIRIASAVFTVRFVNDPAVIQNEFRQLAGRVPLEATEIASMSEIMSALHKEAFSGDLEHLCSVELFQMLEFGAKTGVLALNTDIGNGAFTFNKGKVVTAVLGRHREEKAVFEVLKSNRGTFVFSPKSEIADRPAIKASTTALLMEGCRLLDEANLTAR
jgi:pSer/pThr/pTyr-binding forkhead associated (FHA) protein